VYRVIKHAGSSQSFLPPGGVGYGIGEGLGIVLNRIIKGPSKYQTFRNTIVGTVTEETADELTVERTNGQRARIKISDIVERRVIA